MTTTLDWYIALTYCVGDACMQRKVACASWNRISFAKAILVLLALNSFSVHAYNIPTQRILIQTKYYNHGMSIEYSLLPLKHGELGLVVLLYTTPQSLHGCMHEI